MHKGEGAPPGSGPTPPPFPPTARRYPEVVTRTHNPIRRLYHAALVLLGWTLFVVTWYRIFYRHTGRETALTFLLLGVVFAGIIVVNLLWVALNVGIYRSRGSRTQVRSLPFRARRDVLGRPLEHPAWPEIQRATVVTVRIDPERGVKTYEVAAAGPAPGERA